MIFSFKKITVFLMLTIIVFSLAACGNQSSVGDINPNELVNESIQVMKDLKSYVANVSVEATSKETESLLSQIKATVTYHEEPFAYSNLQEISAPVAENSTMMDQFTFYLLAKDEAVYMYNPLTGLWSEDNNPEINRTVVELANIFDSFSVENFDELTIASQDKTKITIEGNANSSSFLYNLMQSIDPTIIGSFTMVIDSETKYLESMTYLPQLDTDSDDVKQEIKITVRAFNEAPEVVIPEEAKQQ